MTLVAVVALILAIICGVAGWLAFGENMTVNVLSGLMELFLGFVVATFIINRMEKRQTKREWAAAYAAINGLLAATFVDVMRLLHVRVAKHYERDEARYAEFVQVAIFHSMAMRSAIEGFATVLEPGSHQRFRAIELRLSWLTQKLSDRQGFCPGEEYLKIMHQIAEGIAELLQRQGDAHYILARKASLDIARRPSDHNFDEQGFTGAIGKRYMAQTQLLHELGIVHPSGRYIFDDIDNELAIAYFALDRELLSIADSSPTTNTPSS